MRTLTADYLFAYANQIARNAEAENKGTVYPTIREAARHFRVRQQDIEDACNDYTGPGYLGLIVGIRTGAGIGSYDRRGDCQVEAYKDRDDA